MHWSSENRPQWEHTHGQALESEVGRSDGTKLVSSFAVPAWRWGMTTATAAAIALLSLVATIPAGVAQDSEIPSGPLEVDPDDPLLPRLVVDRPLSPQERSVLNAAIDELSQEGQARYAEGDVLEALDIWFRELRLRRALGDQDEVDALSRVGEVAWRESQTTEVRLITERLFEIEQSVQTQEPVDYDRLLAIAEAYQKVRARDYAVNLYDQILAQARLENDKATEEKALRALGALHLAWFDYPNAALAYRDLLALVRAKGDQAAVIDVLRQLARIYDEAEQPADSIAVRQELVTIFERRRELTEIPALKLAIANDYRELGRPDLAAPTYQEAFAIARSVQYYGYAGEALENLAALYEDLDRIQDALVVYRLLLDVERQSYDYYGMMNAYDKIARIHQRRGATDQAIAAYRQGLAIAQQISFRVDYFTEQIQALTP